MPLYSILLLAVLLLTAPFWLLRMATTGRYRAGLAGRLGRLPPDLKAKLHGKDVLWLHAVSVGEVLAVSELIAGLLRARPGLTVALSTTTEAGQRLARTRFPDLPVFYLPLDFALLLRRTLRTLRPRLLVLVESEFWPNLIREAARGGAAIAVVNARISDRSFPRYLRLRRLWQQVLRPVALFLAQGEESAGRLRALGLPPDRIEVAGNLKFDIKPPARGPIYHRLREVLPGGARLLLAGSTLPGEEQMLLEAWPALLEAVPGATLLLAPRHPDRFPAVAALIEQHGFLCLRAGTLPENVSLPRRSILLLDTIGDLAGLYELAAAAFIGGSLVPAGGHNPLEPARFGVPVLLGPSFENFREIVEAMQARGAIRIVPSPRDLSPALLQALLGDRDMRAMGERGAEVFRSEGGATARTLDRLLALLDQQMQQSNTAQQSKTGAAR